MKRISAITFSIVLMVVWGCKQSPPSLYVSKIYVTKVFENKANDFGYEVYKDNTLLIHQTVIPGTEGNSGFKSKVDAQKVASFVTFKLDKGIMPPSISVQELDSLKILE